MDDLLLKANIDEAEIKSYAIRTAADELSKLSEPCYYPEISSHNYQFLHLTNLTDQDIRASFKEFFKGVKTAPLSIHRDPKTLILVFLMYYFLKKRDQSSYISILLYYVLKAYSNLMHGRIQYCNKDVFRYTLEHMSKTHLFNREKSISGAMYHIMKEMQNRYTDDFLSKDAERIGLFMSECRSRIRQSITSFQNAYYKFSKEGLKYRQPYVGEEGEEFEYQIVEKRNLLIDTITKSITVYREIDEKALAEAKSTAKIRESISRQIVEELTNVKYQENVKLILDLFIRDIKAASTMCGKDFFPYVRSLMAVKKTNKPIYFKQQIYELLVKILKSIKALDTFLGQTPQTKSLHGSFLAFYIAMFLKNKICK
jgi:hypothetical protein